MDIIISRRLQSSVVRVILANKYVILVRLKHNLGFTSLIAVYALLSFGNLKRELF